MAQFCAVFPWCTPETFWNLTIDEYTALVNVLEEAARGS